MLNNQPVMEIGGKIIIPNNNNNANWNQHHDRRRSDDHHDDNNQWNGNVSSDVSQFGDVTAYIFDQQHHHHHHLQPHYSNVRSESPSSSHAMCLKLGKRNYFEDTSSIAQQQHQMAVAAASFNHASKRNRSLYSEGSDTSGADGGGGWETYSSATDAEVEAAMKMMRNNGVLEAGRVMVRCQVEGCNVTLENAKEYHRRHKVCEMHSKAPNVVVFGLQQRFCQQCSRFHELSEFDDAKRSCRRRLMGHNERRRKSPHDALLIKNNTSQASPTDRALSLLSSKRSPRVSHDQQPYVIPSDLSSRSSAALRELIAENRAAVLSNQLLVAQDGSLHCHEHNNSQSNHGSSAFMSSLQPHQMYNEQLGLVDCYHQEGGAYLTLDLMQAPSSAFGCLSVGGKQKHEEAKQCSDELWNSLEDEG